MFFTIKLYLHLNYVLILTRIVCNRTIFIKMDLVLNNLQRLVCHKTQTTKQATRSIIESHWTKLLLKSLSLVEVRLSKKSTRVLSFTRIVRYLYLCNLENCHFHLLAIGVQTLVSPSVPIKHFLSFFLALLFLSCI